MEELQRLQREVASKVNQSCQRSSHSTPGGYDVATLAAAVRAK
jgi:hypothetical protein